MREHRLKLIAVTIVLSLFQIQIESRVYIPNHREINPISDFDNSFSDELNDNLLFKTFNQGEISREKAYKGAGLTLQNKIINRRELDSAGRKLIQEYDTALKTVKNNNISKNKGKSSQKESPQERGLLQVATPQTKMIPPKVVYQPQYIPMNSVQQFTPNYIQAPQTIANYVRAPQSNAGYVQVQVPQNSANYVQIPMGNPVNQETQSLQNEQQTNQNSQIENTDTKKSIKTNNSKKEANKKHLGVISKSDDDKTKRKLYYRRRSRRSRSRRSRSRRSRSRRSRSRRSRSRRRRPRRRRPRGPPYNPYKAYRSKKNIAIITNALKKKLAKSKLNVANRVRFDIEKEKKIRGAAEKWTRTFIYDAVLLTEKTLYEQHSKEVKFRMKNSSTAESEAKKGIDEFYNKYYGVDKDQIKPEDLVHHVFD